MNKIDEDKLFRQAIEALKKNVPMQLEYEILAHQPDFLIGRYKPDYLAKVKFQDTCYDYLVEVKNAVTNQYIYMLLTHKDHLPHPMLLVTQYVNREMAEVLKTHRLEFIDTVGNAFINKPALYVFVKGNRPDEPLRQPVGRLFKNAGLKLIYALFCNPGLENKTFREIATIAKIALGTVDGLMKELKAIGYLIDMGKQGNRLVQKDGLLKRWITAYPEQLRPKQILGRYKGQPEWWQNINLDPMQAQWGGEVAASRLTHYLRPQNVTIYTLNNYLNHLLTENKLQKDPMGETEFLEIFWNHDYTGQDDQWQHRDLTHPILVYADLLATGDPRNIETAGMIYNEYLVRLVREN